MVSQGVTWAETFESVVKSRLRILSPESDNIPLRQKAFKWVYLRVLDVVGERKSFM